MNDPRDRPSGEGPSVQGGGPSESIPESEAKSITRPALSGKQMIAFKIGARARKFAMEGCPIEGYDYLYACLDDARQSDAELHALLLLEADKLERRMAALELEEMGHDEAKRIACE